MSVLNGVRDFSKINADKMTQESTPFSLFEIIEQIRRMHELAAAEKDIQLKLHYPDNDAMLMGDPIRLTQIINILVSNAIKFTEHGEVAVTINSAARADSKRLLEIHIQDSGIGMTDEQLKQIFQPLMQADSAITRTHGGTGLGLLNCKRLAELMSGELTMHSEVGVGTESTVKIPLFTAPSQTRTRHLTVLLVDDVETNREVASGMLEEVGHRIIPASNGLEALDIFRRRCGEIDVILMDCLMPEMDGYEATRKIRALEQDGRHAKQKRAPIIALTASALGEIRTKCLEAGMDDFVSKPFEERELLGKLQQWAGAIGAANADDLKPDSAIVSAVKVVDHNVLDELFERFGEERGKLVLGMFMSSIADFSNNLQTAFAQGDNKTMHRMVHNLKSSCGSVGATSACTLAIALEKSIEEAMEKNSGSFSDPEPVERLVKYLDEARGHITQRRPL